MFAQTFYLLSFLLLVSSTWENEFVVVSTTSLPPTKSPIILPTSRPPVRQNNAALPKNCKEVKERGNTISKVYTIKPESSPAPILALCDMKRRGGGWTYILNRYDGSQPFNLYWNNYKAGFGSPSGEHWLGLQNIHLLTGYEINELLIELVDWNGKEVYAYYDSFSVGSESEGYNLKILENYEGTAGVSFNYAAKAKFTTVDRDQDSHSGNCAANGGERAGWWFHACTWSLLTGMYYRGNAPAGKGGTGMFWDHFHGSLYSLKQARMMVRPRDVDFLPHEKLK